MQTLVLRRTASGWSVTFLHDGRPDPAVVAAFGTATLPTPYHANVPFPTVRAALASRNPGATVTLGA